MMRSKMSSFIKKNGWVQLTIGIFCLATTIFGPTYVAAQTVGSPCTVTTTSAPGTWQQSRSSTGGLYCAATDQEAARRAAGVDTNKLTDYKLLEPLPLGGSAEPVKTVNAQTYIPGLFRLVLALASVLAVVRLIYAGIIYMSSDAYNNKSEAKEVIREALWGLALAMSAWIIVATILPQENGKFIFNLSLPTTALPPSTTITTTGDNTSSPSNLTQPQVMQMLQAGGIQIVGAPKLDGLQLVTINELKRLYSTCSCKVMLTSATGGQHNPGPYSHTNGYKVDLRSGAEGQALTDYITRNYTKLTDRSDGAKMYRAPSGAVYALESSPAHWDMQITGS